MKNYRFFQFLISLFLMGNSVSLLAQDISGIDGWGTASDPILINWAQGTSPLQKLNKIAKWVNKDASGTDGWRNNWTSTNKHFKLEADISGFTNVIGTQASPFCGIFDGNGHMITVNINKPTIGNVALFGCAAGATITQLTVAGNVRGAYAVAGLLGQGGNTTITFCTNVANVRS